MTGGENRRRSILKALRKKRIDSEIYSYLDRGNFAREHGYYNNLHQYSKNKIHCSCPMCSAKTRNKGHSRYRGNVPGVNYKISDVRKIERLEYEED